MAESSPIIPYADPFLQAGGSITEQGGELIIYLPVRRWRFARVARGVVGGLVVLWSFSGCLFPLAGKGRLGVTDYVLLGIVFAGAAVIEVAVRQRQGRLFENPWARLLRSTAAPSLRLSETSVTYDGPVLNGNANLPDQALTYPLSLLREMRLHRFAPGILVFIRDKNILHLPDCGSPDANQRLIEEVVSWCAKHGVHVETAE